MSVLEVMSSGAEQRNLYAIKSEEAKQQMAVVEQLFGPQNWARYISISNPVFNPVLNTRVVTCVCGVIPAYLYDVGARAAERKFHLDTGFQYDKMYTFAPALDELPALPEGAQPIAIGFNHRIAGLGGDPAVEQVWDVYFIADPATTEAFYSLEEKRGEYATMYGVTYMRDTKEIVRVKVYTYDSEQSHYDWEQALQIALATNTE